MKYAALVGAGLLVLGLLLSLCGFFAGGVPWIYADRTGIHVGDTSRQDSRIQEKLKAFQELEVDVNLAAIYVVKGDRYAIDIQYDGAAGEPAYSLEKGVLKIWDTAPSDSFLNFNLAGLKGVGSNKITVTVPASADLRRMELCTDLGEIQCAVGAKKMLLDAALGDIQIQDIAAGEVKVKADLGACTITNLTADSLELTDNLGKATLEKIQCAKFEADMDNGALTVRDSSLGKADVDSSLGKVVFERVSTDGLEVECDNGSMELSGTFAGESRLINSLGSIRVSTALPKDSCRYEMSLDMGSAYVDGKQVKGGELFGGPENAANRMEIEADMGSVWLDFSK